MHSFLSRLNAIFAFALSILAGVTFACFASTFFKNYTTPVEISGAKPLLKNLPDYSANRAKNDLAVVNFDLQVDLSPLFDWNTKQLFLYLTAEYKTAENALNQVVLWDKIVMREDNPLVDLTSSNTKYYFWDDGNGLRGNEVNLTLSWNVIPNAGRMPFFTGLGSHKMVLPQEYHVNRIKFHQKPCEIGQVPRDRELRPKETLSREHRGGGEKNYFACSG